MPHHGSLSSVEKTDSSASSSPGVSILVDVIVVGAGMAGLTCAHALHRQGLAVVVLEARDQVGGRTSSVYIDGEAIELGGQFLGPGQDRAYALAAELGVKTFPTYCAGHHLAETPSGKLRRYKGTVPRLSPLALLDVARAQRRFERLARTIDTTSPWQSPNAEKLDGQTLETWIRRATKTPRGRRLFTMACEAIWSCQPNELSLLHALFYAKAAGGLDAVVSIEGGAQQDRVDGGTHGLAMRLAERLGEQVQLNAPVRSIVQNNGQVEVTTATGITWKATHAVVALPPPLAARIHYEPPLPAARDSLLQRLPMGRVIKCMAVYPAPFWRAAGLSGQAISLRGPIGAILDSSPQSAECGVLLGFVEGAAASVLARHTPERRRAVVLDQFVRLFGADAAKPVRYVDRDWNCEPFTRGAYAAVFPPGAWTQFGYALRPPCGRIYWAGAETAVNWYGYIEGAIRSGEAAASAILDEQGY